MTTPQLEEDGVIREWAPMSQLLQEIPLRSRRGLFLEDVKLTCVDAVKECIVVGTSMGIVYWYDRSSHNVLRLSPEKIAQEITCVKLVSTVDFMVAAGDNLGVVSIFRVPKPPPDWLTPERRDSVDKTVERFTVAGLHTAPVTSLEWSINGQKLFSGDANGVVVFTEIDFCMNLSKAREILNEKYQIVQLSYNQHLKALIVSTLLRCIVCFWQQQTWQILQVGQKERNSLLGLGGLFSSMEEKPSEIIVYSCRPGLRLWLANTEGSVRQTIMFKDALKNCKNPVCLLRSVGGQNGGVQGPSEFGRLLNWRDGLLVSHAPSAMLVIDPARVTVVSTLLDVPTIASVATTPDEIFVICGSRNLLRLSYSPDLYDTNINNVATGETVSSLPKFTASPVTGTILDPDFRIQPTNRSSLNTPEAVLCASEVTYGTDTISLPPVVALHEGVLELRVDPSWIRKLNAIGEQGFEDIIYTPHSKSKSERRRSKKKSQSNSILKHNSWPSGTGGSREPITAPEMENGQLEFPAATCSEALNLEGIVPNDILPDLRNIDSIVEDVKQKELLLDAIFDFPNSNGNVPHFEPGISNIEDCISISSSDHIECANKQMNDVQREEVESSVEVHPEEVEGSVELHTEEVEGSVEVHTEEVEYQDEDSFNKNCQASTSETSCDTDQVDCNVNKLEYNFKEDCNLNMSENNANQDCNVNTYENNTSEDCNVHTEIQANKEVTPESSISCPLEEVKLSSSECLSAESPLERELEALEIADPVSGIFENEKNGEFEKYLLQTSDYQVEEIADYYLVKEANLMDGIAYTTVDEQTPLYPVERKRECGDWVELSCPERAICLSSSKELAVICSPSLSVYFTNANFSLPEVWQKAPYKAEQISLSLTSELACKVHIGVAQFSKIWQEGYDWDILCRDVQSIAVDGESIWYVTKGKLFYLRSISSTAQGIHCDKPIAKVFGYQSIILVLTMAGQLMLYENDVWRTIPYLGKEGKQVAIGPRNLVWLLDENSNVYITENISAKRPTWWQVIVGDWQTKAITSICTTEESIILNNSTRDSILINNNSVTAYKWESCDIDKKCLQLTAEGVFEDKGSLWILAEGNQLFCVAPFSHNCQRVNVPCNVVCVASAPQALWLLSEEGRIYVRQGISESNPNGTQWTKLNLEQIKKSVQLSHISCGVDVVWACDIRGEVLMLVASPHSVANNPFPPAWVYVDGSPISNNTFTKVYVGPQSFMVWALDNAANVYVREGVFPDFLPGAGWVHVDGVKASHLSISDEAVWALTKDGVYKRLGISQSNYIGDSWLLISVELDYISASVSEGLWGIASKGGHLVSYYDKVFPISSQACAENDWTLLSKPVNTGPVI